MGSVTAQLQLFQQLEGQLLKLRKEKSFTDPAVRDVRRQLRAQAEVILLQNYRAAVEKGLESKLWHQCFHRPVQDFRRCIQETEAKGPRAAEVVVKLKKAFDATLVEGMAFYKGLALKLQRVYGDAGFVLSTRELGNFTEALAGLQAAEARVDVSTSVHRCLICIGDLTRYQIQLAAEGKADWTAADEFYCQAIKVNPESGNAYNQRAVLAAQDGRDLQAVYYYFRSLGVPSPFHVAKENLIQLFEKVRKEHGKLPQAAHGRGSKPAAGWKLPELTHSVQTRFLHLQGLLFTCIDLDSFSPLMKAALGDLDSLLERDAVARGPPGHGPERSDLVLLQLAALVIYNPANLAKEDATSEMGPVKRRSLRSASINLYFIYTTRLAQTVATAAAHLPQGIATSPLLPAINVLLQWAATNPQALRDPEAEKTVGRNLFCKGLSELLIAAAASCEKLGFLPSQALCSHTEILQAFPEDVEMRAYSPLALIQGDLQYSQALDEQAAAVPRLKRVVLLLHKIGEGLHAAKASDHPNNVAGGKHIASFTTKLGASLQPGGTGLGAEVGGPEEGQEEEEGDMQPQANQGPMGGLEEADGRLDLGKRGAGEDEEEVIVFNPTPSPAPHSEAPNPTPHLPPSDSWPQLPGQTPPPTMASLGMNNHPTSPLRDPNPAHSAAPMQTSPPHAAEAGGGLPAAALGGGGGIAWGAVAPMQSMDAEWGRGQAEGRVSSAPSGPPGFSQPLEHWRPGSGVGAGDPGNQPLQGTAPTEQNRQSLPWEQGAQEGAWGRPQELGGAWKPADPQQAPALSTGPAWEAGAGAGAGKPDGPGTAQFTEPPLSAGLQAAVAKLEDSLAQGPQGLGLSAYQASAQAPGSAQAPPPHNPNQLSQEPFSQPSTRSATPRLPQQGSLHPPPQSAQPSRQPSGALSQAGTATPSATSRGPTSFEDHVRAPLHNSAFQGPWGGAEQGSSVSGLPGAAAPPKAPALQPPRPDHSLGSQVPLGGTAWQGLGSMGPLDPQHFQSPAPAPAPAAAPAPAPQGLSHLLGQGAPPLPQHNLNAALMEHLSALQNQSAAVNPTPAARADAFSALQAGGFQPQLGAAGIPGMQLGRQLGGVQGSLPSSLGSQGGLFPQQQQPAAANTLQLQALLNQLNSAQQPMPQYGNPNPQLTLAQATLQAQMARMTQQQPRTYQPPPLPVPQFQAANPNMASLAHLLQQHQQQQQPQAHLGGLTTQNYDNLMRSLPPRQAAQVQQMVRNGGIPIAGGLPQYQTQPQLGSSTGTGAFFPAVPSSPQTQPPTFGQAPSFGQTPSYGSASNLTQPGSTHPSFNSLQNQALFNAMMAQKAAAQPGALPSRPASVMPQPQMGAGAYDLSRGNPLAGLQAPSGGGHLPGAGATATDLEGLQRLIASNPGGLKLEDLLRRAQEPQPPQQAFNPTPWLNNARHTSGTSTPRAPPAVDPIAQLQKQLSAHSQDLPQPSPALQNEAGGSNPADPSRTVQETPFARQAQRAPWDVASEAGSLQQGQGPPPAGQPPAIQQLQQQAPPASGGNPFLAQQQQPGTIQQGNPWGNPQATSSVAQQPQMFAAPDARQASTEVRAGSMAPPAPEEAGAPPKEQGTAAPPASESWGPFAGLGGGFGGPWQQQWRTNPVDAPPKPASQAGDAQWPSAGSTPTWGQPPPQQTPTAPQATNQDPGLSNFFRNTQPSQNKPADNDWHAQLKSLQSASQARSRAASPQPPALGTANPQAIGGGHSLFGQNSWQSVNAAPGGSRPPSRGGSVHSLGGAERPPNPLQTQVSGLGSIERPPHPLQTQGSGLSGIEQRPANPLQTLGSGLGGFDRPPNPLQSHGSGLSSSGLWGAPPLPRQPASNFGGLPPSTAGQAAAPNWIFDQQQRNARNATGYFGNNLG